MYTVSFYQNTIFDIITIFYVDFYTFNTQVGHMPSGQMPYHREEGPKFTVVSPIN